MVKITEPKFEFKLPAPPSMLSSPTNLSSLTVRRTVGSPVRSNATAAAATATVTTSASAATSSAACSTGMTDKAVQSVPELEDKQTQSQYSYTAWCAQNARKKEDDDVAANDDDMLVLLEDETVNSAVNLVKCSLPVSIPIKRKNLPSTSKDSNDKRDKEVESRAGPSNDEIPSTVYKEPVWSGTPPQDSRLDIFKMGKLVTAVKLTKPYYIVGRLPGCDIVMEHPTISRYHAVIQYCRGGEDLPSGFYVYDLESTHGTYIDRKTLKSNLYYSLQTFHLLRFGMSSKHLCLYEPKANNSKATITKEADSACNWGLKEDAEEDDLTENPFALTAENEELFLDDPKKALRGWFEREGYELEYKVEEKGLRKFSCTVKLPVDNPYGEYLPVEATVEGKKKEAVIACALEACRTLDRLGLLRQSKHESHQKKQKNWEDDDYYDSDEDPFLDRTGTLEKKREWRKQMGKNNITETYESIVKKLEVLCNEINEIKEKLQQSKAKTESKDNKVDMDPLDSYMLKIKDPQNTPLDPVTKSKLKCKLIDLIKRRKVLEQMRDASASSCSTSAPDKCSSMAVAITSKELGSKLQKRKEETVVKETESLKDLPDAMETTKKEALQENMINDMEVEGLISGKVLKADADSCVEKKEISTDTQIEDKDQIHGCEQVTQFMACNFNAIKSVQASTQHQLSCKRPAPMSQLRDAKKKNSEHRAIDTEISSSVSSAEEYSTWLPPTDQSGDGSTFLNKKFGY